MFNLEEKIEEWRRRMFAGGIKTRALLDELESHLRADIEARAKAGLDAQKRFELAVEQIGPAGVLRLEFVKIGSKSWNRKLAYAAWGLFVVSFILPSFDHMRGWQCAFLQMGLWSDALGGRWYALHYELLTLANLFMLASPWLLFRFGSNPRAMKWFRGLSTASVLLVWSFIGLFFIFGGWRDLKVGCFAWGTSFVLLLASTFRRPSPVPGLNAS